MAVAARAPTAQVKDATIYVGIQSGLRPDNGGELFGPGDIRIVVHSQNSNNAGDHTFGIEVGGGAPCPSGGCTGGQGGAVDVTGGAHVEGSTYTLHNGGYTQSTDSSNGLFVGGLYENTSWINGNDNFPTQLAGGSLVNIGGTDQIAEFHATWDDVTQQHSIIELGLSAAFLEQFLNNDMNSPDFGAVSFSVYWGPACYNDIVATDVSIAWPDVPEPGTLTVFTLGLLGMGAARARRRKAARAA